VTDIGPDPSDTDLVARARDGEDDAFAEIVRRHERRVYNLAYRMLGRTEDARDAAQEAFVSCYKNLRKFRGDAAFSTWLHRIAVNACYDVLRKRPQEPVELNEALGGAASSDHADRTTSAVDIQRALTNLPADFRVVVIMHDVQGFPYEDIAGALEVPIGTVKSRLHRGRVALGVALGLPGKTERSRGEPRGGRTPSKPSTAAAKRSRQTASKRAR
jgi:RNA polymerase sigma-70 factor (ECF subfamily)